MNNTLRFMRAEWKSLRIGLLHTFFSGFGQTFFLSLFSGFIIEEFGLSRTEYGGLYSIATLVSALTLPIPGNWIDRWQLKHYSLMTGLIVVGACLIFAWSPNLYALGLSLYLLRFAGQGLMSHIAGTTMSRHFGAQRGKALSLVNLGYPIAEALIPVLTLLILQSQMGWRIAPLIMAGLALFIFIPASWSWIRQSPEVNLPPLLQPQKETPAHESASWTRKQALQSPYIYLILPVYLSPPFLITGFFIQQSSLDELYSWEFQNFSVALIWFSVLRFLGSLFSGPVLDKFGAQRLIYVYTLPLFVGIALTYSSLGPYFLFALAGATAGAGGSIKTALLNEVYGSQHLGSIRSFATSIMAFSTAVSPLLFGMLLDLDYGFSSILEFGMGFILIAQVLLVVAQTRYKPDSLQSNR